MQRGGRLILAAAVIVFAPLMSACSDVVDKFETLELFDTKKKLAGERKPVFPEGVPGATSGVPAELVKGYQQPESGPVDPAKAAAEAAAADHARSKPKSQPQPKPQQTAAKPPPQRTAAKPPTASTDANASPAPAAAPPAAGAPAPWPAQQPQAAAQPQPAWPGGAPATR